MATPFSMPDNIGQAPFGQGRPGMGFTGTRGQTPLPSGKFTFPTSNTNNLPDSDYTWQGRPRVTYTVNVNLQASSALSKLGAEHLMFVKHTNGSDKYNQQYTGMISLSALNRELDTPEGRAKFCNTPEDKHLPTKLLQTYYLWGVQQTDTDWVEEYKNRHDAALTTFIAHRVKIPDLWLACGRLAMPGDHLWLLLVREEEAGQHKWVYRPYLATDRAAPPTCEYMGPGCSWIGMTLFVGVVTDRYNSVQSTDNTEEDSIKKWKLVAEKVITPTSIDEARDAARILPKVEVMFRCK